MKPKDLCSSVRSLSTGSMAVIFSVTMILVLVFTIVVSASSNQGDPTYYYAANKKIALTPDYTSVMVTFAVPVSSVDIRSFVSANPSLGNAIIHQPVNAIVFTFNSLSASFNELLSDLKSDGNVANVFPAYINEEGKLFYISNTMLYKLNQNGNASAVKNFLSKNTEATVKSLDLGFENPTVEIKLNRFVNTIDVSNQLQESGLVEFSQPNFIYEAAEDFTPNDPSYASQWFLNNTGQTGGTNDADIDAKEAWDITTGSSSVVVAVIDGNGYDLNHVELTGRYVSAYDAVNDDSDPSPENSFANHGTCCAGLVAANTNNGVGVASVGFNVSVCPVVIGYNATSNGTFNTSDAIVAAAASHVVSVAGVVSATNSFSGLSGTSSNLNSYSSLQTNCRGGLGAVVLCSSGNSGTTNIVGPANFAGNLAVGATTFKDKKASYSSYGNVLDITAPGDVLLTIDRTGTAGYNTASTANGGDYLNFSGTSAASPVAAAVVGLMGSVNSSLTGADLRDILQENCDKVGGVIYKNSGQHPLSTWHKKFGYGRVNALAAVTAAQGPHRNSNQLSAEDIQDFMIYPNPVAAGQSITIDNSKGYQTIHLVALNGTILLSQNIADAEAPIQLSIPENVTSGLYFVEMIKSDGDNRVKKIMIE